MTNLKSLHLNYKNSLETDKLVDELDYSKFNQLETLKFTNGYFSNLPGKAYSLTNLKDLKIYGFDNFKEVPTYFSEKFPNLTSLTISSCSLKEFPTRISKFQKLKFLDLSGNYISLLPREISDLKELVTLDMGNNKFNSFPTEVLDMTNLLSLSIGGSFNSVPGREMGIGRLKNLKYLGLRSCGLKEFPDVTLNSNLSMLWLDSNKLSSIPGSVSLDGTSLTSINLTRNNFTTIPNKLIEYSKKFKDENALDIYMDQNYIQKLEPPLKYFNINSSKQLMLEYFPSKVSVSDKFKMHSFISDENDDVWQNEAIPYDNIEITFVGKNTNTYISKKPDEIVEFVIPDTYKVNVKIIGSDESNKSANYTTELIVNQNSNDSDILNDERLKKIFTDDAFREQIQITLDYEMFRGCSTFKCLESIDSIYINDENITNIEGIENLTGIKNLAVSNTNITGFPKGVENLKNIKTLSLNNNKNTIKIPKFVSLNSLLCGSSSGQAIFGQPNSSDSKESIEAMSQLEYLDLIKANSSDSGSSIAESLDYSKLSNLKSLDITENGLNKIPDSTLTLHSLEALNANNNNKISTLPQGFGSSMTNLELLFLENCKLNSFPNEVLNLKDLRMLSLYNNNISNIPEPLEKMSIIEYLELGKCNLTSIPNSLFSNKSIRYLSLASNNIRLISNEIRNLNDLVYLDISNCGLTQFPKELLLNDKIQNLDISKNAIKSIPDEITKLVNLSFLRADKCELNVFPRSFFKKKNLEYLTLNDNDFSKDIGFGKEMKQCNSVVCLELQSCSLNNNNIAEIFENKTIKNITLSNNNILNIPEFLGLSKSSFGNIDLSFNHIISIPEKMIEGIRFNNIFCNLVGNYIESIDSSISENVIIDPKKQLFFTPEIEKKFYVNSEIKLYDMLCFDFEDEFYLSPSIPELYEFEILDSNRNPTNNATIDSDNTLTVKVAGNYIVVAYIKGSKFSNLKHSQHEAMIHVENASNNGSSSGSTTIQIPGINQPPAIIPSATSTSTSIPTSTPTPTATPTATSANTSDKTDDKIPSSSGVSFVDLGEKHWAKDFINAMAQKGIITGYKDGRFNPEGKITRAEFASMIAKLLKLDIKEGTSSFNDVKKGDWYLKSVIAANKAGIISGWNGSFKPNDSITRQDAAIIISKTISYIKKIEQKSTMDLKFQDNKLISRYATDHVKNVCALKIMGGKSGNVFDPKGYTKRSEVAKMIFMLSELY